MRRGRPFEGAFDTLYNGRPAHDHLFEGGESLCRTWVFEGGEQVDPDEIDPDDPDLCDECAELAAF